MAAAETPRVFARLCPERLASSSARRTPSSPMMTRYRFRLWSISTTFARMDVLSDKHAVEDGKVRIDNGPGRAVKTRLAAGEQQIDGRRILYAESPPPGDMGRVAGFQRAKDRAKRALAKTVCSRDQRIGGEFGIPRELWSSGTAQHS